MSYGFSILTISSFTSHLCCSYQSTSPNGDSHRSIILMGRDTNMTPSWKVFCFSIYQQPWAHRGGNTSCGLGKRHSNRWLDAIARGPLFFVFFLFFFPSSLLDPMIPIWVSVRAAIHHWLDYLVGREQRAIHLRSWHNPGQSDAMLPAPPLLLRQLLQNWALETHTYTSSLLHRRWFVCRNVNCHLSYCTLEKCYIKKSKKKKRTRTTTKNNEHRVFYVFY